MTSPFLIQPTEMLTATERVICCAFTQTCMRLLQGLLCQECGERRQPGFQGWKSAQGPARPHLGHQSPCWAGCQGRAFWLLLQWTLYSQRPAINLIITLSSSQVAARKTLLGEGAVMKGHSMGLFGITNKYRLATFKLLYSQVSACLAASGAPATPRTFLPATSA